MNSLPTVIISVFATAVVSFLIAWLFRHRSYRPLFQYSHTLLLDPNGEAEAAGVRIMLGDEALPRVSRTVLVLWNGGARPLRKEDVARPIYFSFDAPARIFFAAIIEETRPGDEIQTCIERVSESKFSLRFSHLDRGDGIALYLLHDSSEKCPKIEGTIIGRREPFENMGAISHRFSGHPARDIVLTLLPSLVAMAWGAMVWAWTRLSEGQIGGEILIYFALGQAIVLIWREWQRRRRYPRKLAVLAR